MSFQETTLPRLVVFEGPGLERKLMLVFADDLTEQRRMICERRKLRIHWLARDGADEIYFNPLYVPNAVQPIG